MKVSWTEPLLLSACLVLLAIQLLLPGYIGIANNGDFGKVYARFDLGPPDEGQLNFIYFVPDYDFSPRYHWVSNVLSSEIVLAAVPILVVKAAGAAVFNIRWLGALHAAIFLAAYGALLQYLRRWGPAQQFAIGIVALWIFGDVAYVAYLNSFFSDTPALLGLLLMVPLSLQLGNDTEPRRATVWLFTAAAALFISSKMQHGIYGLMAAIGVLLLTWRWPRLRSSGVAACALLLAVEGAGILTTTADYRVHPLFTVVFFKIVPTAPSPREALTELGLGDSEMRYVGQHAYTAGSPVLDAAWRDDFGRRASYARVFGYWLRHPGRALAALHQDLVIQAPLIRPPNLSNFKQSDGKPAGAFTRRFASWSTLRSWLLVMWPAHMVLWYALVIGVSAVMLLRRGNAAGMVCLCIAIAAILEFLFASLTDGIETYRHLLLFHLMTDVTILFAMGWVFSVSSDRGLRAGRTPGPDVPVPKPRDRAPGR